MDLENAKKCARQMREIIHKQGTHGFLQTDAALVALLDELERDDMREKAIAACEGVVAQCEWWMERSMPGDLFAHERNGAKKCIEAIRAIEAALPKDAAP